MLPGKIDVFGRVRRNIEAADADLAAEVESRRDVLVTLLSEVARNYIELRSFQRQVAIAHANLEAQQETLDLTRIRFDAGLASDLDVARAEAQVQTTASQIPRFETFIQQSIHLLSVLLGQEPNALQAELTPKNRFHRLLLMFLSVCPRNYSKAAGHSTCGKTDCWSYSADWCGNRGSISQFFVDRLFWLHRFKGQQRLSMGEAAPGTFAGRKIPIDFGRIRSNIEVQNAREEQAVVTYEQTILTSLQEVMDALVAFSNEQTRRQKLAAAVDSNQRAVDLANDLYQQGLTDFLTVLQAQRDLYLTEDALVQSNREVSSNLVALYKAWVAVGKLKPI